MSTRHPQPMYIHRLYRASKNLAETLREWTGPDLHGLLSLEENELETLELALKSYENRNRAAQPPQSAAPKKEDSK